MPVPCHEDERSGEARARVSCYAAPMRALTFVLLMAAGGYFVTADAWAQRGGASSAGAAADRASIARFAGAWKLVGEEVRDSQGQAAPARTGAAGQFGYIAYDPAGYMSVALAAANRPPFAGAQPTPQEAQAALNSYVGYWGTFAVNAASTNVTHQTFGAVDPATSGTDIAGGFTIAGNRLTLRPPAAANGPQTSLTWERLPDLPTLTPTHRKLIGFWKLIEWGSRNAKGEVVSSSPGTTGFLVYTASGHVIVHMMEPYRRRVFGAPPTPQETMAAYRSYTGYFGTYTVNESEQYVVHHIDATMNSGPVGTNYQRFLEFSGKRVVLMPPVTRTAGREVRTALVWERLSD